VQPRACSSRATLRASSPTAQSATPRCASCISSRAFRRGTAKADATARLGDPAAARKILNVEKARSTSLTFEEIRNLITAMGAGVGDNFNVDKVRYHRS